jgi:DNA polymerase epsilon subunit 2
MSTVAPIFKRPRQLPPPAAHDDDLPPPSSDPFQPVPSSILNRQTQLAHSKHAARQQSPATFLPVEIELSHFRPVAFRVFTKKHNLTLKSDALAVLAEYIGRKCGSEWRVAGEPILDEIARAWARAEGTPAKLQHPIPLLVDAD